VLREKGLRILLARFAGIEADGLAAAALPPQIEGRVADHAQQPGLERAASLESVQMGQRLDEAFLDGVEDPHNLGAIIRTAHAAGATAVVLPERRAAGLTDTVSRAAAGALAFMSVVRVANVNRALEELKRAGYWIYGLDESGEHAYDEVEFTQPSAIVLGGEGKGLHQLVAKHCDFLVRIPMAGGVASLNVSVAAGVMLFEWRRRRQVRSQ
jgi:23S rRNA (guanosine2251-2'-O)-methyltransferase